MADPYLVSDIVTLKERGKYQGIIGMVIATSNSIGPLIGGLLTEKAVSNPPIDDALPN